MGSMMGGMPPGGGGAYGGQEMPLLNGPGGPKGTIARPPAPGVMNMTGGQQQGQQQVANALRAQEAQRSGDARADARRVQAAQMFPNADHPVWQMNHRK
jgi:hypothetical protein